MTVVERVARALARHSLSPEDDQADRFVDAHWGAFVADARVAIEAMREPTSEMIDHAWAWHSREDGEHMTNIWHAMIDTALGKD